MSAFKKHQSVNITSNGGELKDMAMYLSEVLMEWDCIGNIAGSSNIKTII